MYGHRYAQLLCRKKGRSPLILSPSPNRRECLTRRKKFTTRADVEAWRANLISVDVALHKALFPAPHYTKPNHKGNPPERVQDASVFGSNSLKQKVTSVVEQYNYVVSKLVRDHQQQQRQHGGSGVRHKRITGALLAKKPFPTEALSLLESTQNTLLKSLCVRFHALLRAQASPETALPVGLDNLHFTTLREQEKLWTDEAVKNTRYGRSTKSIKIKKDLPLKARITPAIRDTLKRSTQELNWKLMAELWPQLSSKNLKKHNNVRTVSCQWDKCYSFRRTRTFRKCEVAQLRDRVLALIVEIAVHPITEYQADPHSFAWRHRGGRSASMACKYVAHLLEQELAVSSKDVPIRMIKVNVEDCFDTISHEAVLDSYPLIVKYRPFLTGFLRAPRRGHRIPSEPQEGQKVSMSEVEVPTQGWRPKSGVLFDSILGRSLVNNALDGLEEALLRDLPLDDNAQPTSQEMIEDVEALDTHGHNHPRREDVRVIRYGTSILIFGRSRHETFAKIYHRLCVFLKKRGLYSLEMPDNSSPPIFSFRPGTSVEFLGFRYLFTRTGGEKAHPGRFSRGFWSSRTSKYVQPSRFQVFITQSSMNQINDQAKQCMSRRFTPARVENLIRRNKEELRQVVSYFDISPSTHRQIHTHVYKRYKLFKKLLRRKYQSAPKLGTMIKSRFLTRGVKMLKPNDFASDYNQPFAKGAPTSLFLMSNVYLDVNRHQEELGKRVHTPVWIENAFAPRFQLTKGVYNDDEGEADEGEADEGEADEDSSGEEEAFQME